VSARADLPWTLRFHPQARTVLLRLDGEARRRILKTLHAISHLEDPRTRGAGLRGNHTGFWRYRIGNYRVICELIDSELVIVVLDIGHRSTVYR